MDIHVLKAVLIFMITFIVVIGGLINLFEEYLPPYILQTFRCGKHAYVGKKPLLPPIEVPKRWFRHFYIFSSVFSFSSLILAASVYCFDCPAPIQSINFLDFFGTRNRLSTVSTTSVLTALTLITAQCWRRFYETHYVSIFSDARMNLAHYIVGYAHYFLTICSILVEAPGFTHSDLGNVPSNFSWYQILAVSCFLFAFCVQYQTAVIFANMRKVDKGTLTLKHSIPYGGFFKWVSSPHYMAEVLIYLSLTVILWGNTCFMYVSGWVLSNQVESALLTHWWYKSKFKEYPRERKAIFPMLL